MVDRLVFLFLLNLSFASIALAESLSTADSYYNASVREVQNGHFHLASEKLLRSIREEPNPLTVWKELETLETLQRKLGIQDSATRDFFTRFSLFANQTARWALCLGAFWCFTFYVYGRLRYQKKIRFFAVAGVGFLAGFLSCLVVRHHTGSIGVLTESEGKEVTVFRTGDLLEPLITLPAGTVIIGKSKGETFQMREPIAGWIKKEKQIPIVVSPFQ